MSTREELLAAIKYVGERTGDANAWQTGLTPNEIVAVVTLTTPPAELEAIVSNIRRQGAFASGGPSDSRPGPGQDEAAAEAIARAEAGLAQQNSASAQLDMQVVSAILNAHLVAVEGRDALARLQQDTEAAVRSRSDLDTPAGARDFQRFLIGKLRDIRAVVLNASLDDTSKSALMAAWTALYDASKSGPDQSGDHRTGSPASGDAPVRGTAADPADESDAGWDPLLDSLLSDDPGLLAGDAPGPGSTTEPGAAPTLPVTPAMPSMPNVGLGPVPSLPAPGGLPLSGLLGGDAGDPALRHSDDAGLRGAHHTDLDAGASPDRSGQDQDDEDREDDEDSTEEGQSSAASPTTITLPNGETVTAPSPQLAAAIKAAVGGAQIAEAFRQQGITIPPPGTAVNDPIDPLQVTPGDIGMFTDRHALALGPGEALLDGQIQHIATVSGPTFLGWEHPPAATATAAAPAEPNPPTPTRPATTWTA